METHQLAFPILRPHAGIYMGNGNMGVIVWGNDRLCLTVNRADLWDHRNGVCLEDRFANTNFTQNFQSTGGTSDHPTQGTSRYFGGEQVKTYMARGDIQSQISDHHQVSAGLISEARV